MKAFRKQRPIGYVKAYLGDEYNNRILIRVPVFHSAIPELPPVISVNLTDAKYGKVKGVGVLYGSNPVSYVFMGEPHRATRAE